ncbi:MAG: hypothetical protein AAF667_20085 [Pseudomonadota bacterium]
MIQEDLESNGHERAKDPFQSDEVAAREQDFDLIVGQLTRGGEEIDMTRHSAATAAPRDVLVHIDTLQRYSRRWPSALLNEHFLSAVEEIIGPDNVRRHPMLIEKPTERVLCQMHSRWERIEDGKAHSIGRMVLRGWSHEISRAAAGAA